ncbi:MAG TPA: GFA family protein, partial [Vulgatibacter sp.]
TSKCNCTICWKRRWWGVQVEPGAFRPLEGVEELVPYPSKAKSGPGGFCRHCGVSPFASGDAAEWNAGDYVGINLACLDDLDPAVLATAPVRHMDGRADSWTTPAETRHL